MDLDSNDSDNSPLSSISSKNYLTPGNLLQQNCNGSDVFLRKRAVQSTSSLFPSTSAVGGGSDNIKGGPTRFLIVFPGRLSLKAPPPPPTASTTNNNDAAQRTLNDTDNNDQYEEEKNDNNEDKKEKKMNPFAPTHPPHLLGKLMSLSEDGGRMELRIPLPSSSNVASSSIQNDQQMIVMSGRAIPLSGKYMALSFKRTGGSKDSVSSSGGGGGGGGNNKKKGTGSIICKDVFRSVIVLGDSKILDGDGKAVSLEELNDIKKDDDEGEEDCPREMLHYGGSDRALDGGGKYSDGRQGSMKGGTIATTAASLSRKDSIPSKESDDVDSDDSEATDMEENNGDSCDTDEFVPISAKKRKLVGAKKRSATDASDDEADEDLTPARKRTPRRSVDSSKISYVDKSSDEDEPDSSDSDEDDSDKEDAYKQPTRTKVTEKPTAKRSTSTAVAKTNNASKATSKAGSNSKMSSTPALCVDSSEEDNDSDDSLFKGDAYKPSRSKVTEKLAGKKQQAAKTNSVAKASSKAGNSRTKSNTPALSVDSSEEESDAEELIKQSDVRKSTKSATNGGVNGTKLQRSSAAKKVNFSPSNDIINLDSDEDEAEKDELHAISFDARKRLSTLSTNQSPLKSSPISRGRRKKNSPTKSSMTTKDDDLSLDDDPFSFL